MQTVFATTTLALLRGEDVPSAAPDESPDDTSEVVLGYGGDRVADELASYPQAVDHGDEEPGEDAWELTGRR